MSDSGPRGTRVYVGNLTDKVKKEDLEGEFEKYGKLNSVWVAFNPPGFAFVEFENQDEAEKACDILNGTEILGSKLRVEISRGRPKGGRGGKFRGGRGGGGGGFRGGNRSGGGGGPGGFRSSSGGFPGNRNGGGSGGGGGGGFRPRGRGRGGFGDQNSFGGGGRGGGGGYGRDGGRDGGYNSFGGGGRNGGGGQRFRSRSPAGGRGRY